MTFQSDLSQGTRSLARRPIGTSAVNEQLDRSLRPAAEVLSRQAKSRVTNRIWKLGTRLANWDGHGSDAPNERSVQRAAALAEELITLVGQTQEWVDPHAGLDESGDVVLEWWNADRKLTVYVQSDAVEYVKSWGPDIEDQMEHGPLGATTFVKLWEWLRAPAVE